MKKLRPVRAGEEAQIGRIEDLIAAPERRGKMVGERAVVVVPMGEGKKGVETDWIIREFDTETGAVTLNKRDEKGNLLEGKISRETFLAMNFPRSDEMFFTLERERQKGLGKGMSEKSARELEHIAEAKKAFAEGDIALVRRFFSEQVKNLEKRDSEEDEVQRDARKKALKEMERTERDLVKLERHRLGAKESEREADELMIIHSKQDLQDAKKRFEEANLRLGAGHADLDRLRGFISILDQEIERRKKAA